MMSREDHIGAVEEDQSTLQSIDDSEARARAELRFDKFREHTQLLRNTGPDVYTRAHDNCFAELLESDADMQAVFRTFFATYVKLRPKNVALLIAKSSQAVQMGLDKDRPVPTFPEGFDTVEAWEAPLRRITSEEKYRHDFLFNLRLPITSNVSERGKLGLKAVALLNGKEGPISVMDVGCSLNHNLKRLALYKQGGLTYETTEVLLRKGDREEEPDIVDDKSTEIFNKIVQDDPLKIGTSIGVDLLDFDNRPIYQDWAWSNSFYMGELLIPALTKQFKRLIEARPKQIAFEPYLDVTKPDAVEVDRRYDIIYFSTMLYQLRRRERNVALANAHKWVKPDGLIVVQDYVDFKPGGESKYYRKNEWEWNYNVWVNNMAQPDEGFEKYFSVESGRAKRIVLEPAIGKLAVAREAGLVPVTTA